MKETQFSSAFGVPFRAWDETPENALSLLTTEEIIHHKADATERELLDQRMDRARQATQSLVGVSSSIPPRPSQDGSGEKADDV